MNCKGRKADEESASECDIIGQSQKGEKCILSKKKKSALSLRTLGVVVTPRV